MSPRTAAGLALAAALSAGASARADPIQVALATPRDTPPQAETPKIDGDALAMMVADPLSDISSAREFVVDQPKLFTPDDLLLLEVRVDDDLLSDGLSAYSSRAGVYLPLGELARLLDISLVVDPSKRRAEGWGGAPDNPVRVDLNAGLARVGAKELALSAADAVFYDDEIYVRIDLLQQLLPLKIKVDLAGLSMSLTPTQKLPFQDRLERDRRRAMLGFGQTGEAQPSLRVATPYDAFSEPSIDVNLEAAVSSESPRTTGRYEARAAGDFLWSGLQLYAGSDDRGALSDARVLLERKDPDGKIAGPFGATRSSLGDTFTPGLPFGARSAGGRGFAITSASLEQASVFQRIDLRGELPLGYQAELYVNEVLRASQSEAVQGRYEFKDVSLAFGLNVIRVVFYGPRGERRQEVRRINFNGGALQRGQFAYSVGAVEENLTVFGISERNVETLASPLTPGSPPLTTLPGFGKLRVVGSAGYGVTSTTTLTSGFAQYTPRIDDTRQVATLGLITSLAGLSMQFDVAGDDASGSAVGVGLAGRPAGVSVVGRHSEYFGGFLDEVQPAMLGSKADLVRNSNLSVDLVQRFGAGSLPLSLRVSRDEFADGLVRLQSGLRVSQALDRYLVSTALDYQHETGGPAPVEDRLVGGTEVSGLVSAEWQLRGGINYPILPDLRLASAYIAADRAILQRSALHLGVAHSFEGDQTSFQVAQTWRLSAFDLALNSSYTTGSNDFRAGVQLSFGLTPDPITGRYRALGPGAAGGGAVAVRAFVDDNGDGVRQPSERGLAGVELLGGRRGGVTDADGSAIVTGLGDGATAQILVDLNSIEDPYLVAPPRVISIVPRPGRVAVANYALTPTGEAELTMLFRRGEAAPRGLSALQVQLVDAAGGVAAEGRTEFDGTLVLEGLRPGAYAVRLDPEQSGRLGLALAEPVEIVVPAGGGFAGKRKAMVVKTGEGAPVPRTGD